MLFVVVFLGGGIAVWVFAGKMLLFVRKQRRTAALVRKAETTRTAEVAELAVGTAVEVTGFLRCEEPVESEMAGQNCAYSSSALSAGFPGTVAQTIFLSSGKVDARDDYLLDLQAPGVVGACGRMLHDLAVGVQVRYHLRSGPVLQVRGEPPVR